MENTKNEYKENDEVIVESEEVLEVALAEEDTPNTENDEVIVESEEVLEVALAEEDTPNTENDDSFEYTESELSGLTDQQKRRKEIFDKVTTGILIALMASPLAIILYILLWFVFRS